MQDVSFDRACRFAAGGGRLLILLLDLIPTAPAGVLLGVVLVEIDGPGPAVLRRTSEGASELALLGNSTRIGGIFLSWKDELLVGGPALGSELPVFPFAARVKPELYVEPVILTFKPRFDMLGTADVVVERGMANRELVGDAIGAGIKLDEEVPAVTAEDAVAVVVVVATPVESVPVGDSPGRSSLPAGRAEVRDENRGRIWSRLGKPRLNDGRVGR